jgi:hypothetical protein
LADKPNILFIDIETLPNVAWTWGKYDQNVLGFVQESCIASVTAKWLGRGKVFAYALPDYKGYKAGSYDDGALVKDLWKLLDEAAIVVAHNGDAFDIKVINARFIFHKLTPPSPFKTVDTKLLVKKVARFNSNKLDDLGQILDEGRKIHTDFTLWQGCIKGTKASWNQMVAYNKQDVLLLERIYLRLRPWAMNHPNMGLYEGEAVCPKCGSGNIEFRGYALTVQRKYRRFQCKDCGGWGRVTHSEKKGSPYTHVV